MDELIVGACILFIFVTVIKAFVPNKCPKCGTNLVIRHVMHKNAIMYDDGYPAEYCSGCDDAN